MSTRGLFYRLETGGVDPATITGVEPLTAPSGLLAKVRPSDRIVLASWDAGAQVGRVHALGIVGEVGRDAARVDWRPVDFTLHPSPQGRSKWATLPFFKFNTVVAERYGLQNSFDEAFSRPVTAVSDSRRPPPPAKQTAPAPVLVSAATDTNHAAASSTNTGAQRNRVAPDGEIFADPARGAFMGNRTSPPRWLVCDLHFRQNLKQPRKYTKLFFLDEAVALAAGHRPCFRCRRERLQAYLAAVNSEIPVADAARLDALLNAARTGTRPRARLDTLPDGAFVALGAGDFRLKWAGALHRWTPAGYVDATAPADLGVVEAVVLTPGPSLAALRGGYRVQVHPSAR